MFKINIKKQFVFLLLFLNSLSIFWDCPLFGEENKAIFVILLQKKVSANSNVR